MRVVLLCDIHSNLPALDAVLADVSDAIGRGGTHHAR